MSAAHTPDPRLDPPTAADVKGILKPEVAESEPFRRGLAAYVETIAERDRLKRELEDCQLRLAQSETRASGLEHELKRAEIHRDEARVERDAAVREAAKYETFFEAQQAMMREFSPKPAAALHLAEAAE